MSKCENCYHNSICLYKEFMAVDIDGKVKCCCNCESVEHICKYFINKFQIIELSYQPLPVRVKCSIESSDVYCPNCGQNLSGDYGECDVPDVLPCLNCGMWLDNTKSTHKEGENYEIV